MTSTMREPSSAAPRRERSGRTRRGTTRRAPRLAALAAAAIACGLLAAPVDAPAETAPAQAGPDGVMRVFISGHSLNDKPYGEYLVEVADSLDVDIEWEQQIDLGSPIQWRTRGSRKKPGDWNGYSHGRDRSGDRDGNVLDELERAQNDDDPYDVLIIAEGNKSAARVMHNQTPRFLRHFHDRMIERNPNAATFLFQPWESVVDKSNPTPWLALETDAQTIWRCVVDRANVGLERAGRSDRIARIPTGFAFASLMNSAIAGEIPVFARQTTTEVFDIFMKDHVHLNPKGDYFSALLSAASITGKSVQGAWRPRIVSADEASALQTFVDELVAQHTALPQVDFAECRSLMATRFCDAWNAYVPDERNKPVKKCRSYFEREDFEKAGFNHPNPFFIPTEAEEQEYWFKAP